MPYLFFLVSLFPGDTFPKIRIYCIDADQCYFAGRAFFLDPDTIIARRVLDAHGRYTALVSAGTYRIVVEKRVDDETLTPVYEGVVNAPKGVVNERVVVGGKL